MVENARVVGEKKGEEKCGRGRGLKGTIKTKFLLEGYLLTGL